MKSTRFCHKHFKCHKKITEISQVRRKLFAKKQIIKDLLWAWSPMSWSSGLTGDMVIARCVTVTRDGSSLWCMTVRLRDRGSTAPPPFPFIPPPLAPPSSPLLPPLLRRHTLPLCTPTPHKLTTIARFAVVGSPWAFNVEYAFLSI